MTVFRLILTLFLFCLCAPQAFASDAYVNARVNLRAGPDGGYPVVGILKPGARVDLHGCIRGLQWCEVETRSGDHGWVYAYYLNAVSRGRNVTIIQDNGVGGLRIITFQPRNYWDTYYRDKYFYADRDHWLPEDHNHHHDHDGNDEGDDDHHGHHGGGGHNEPPVVTPPRYQAMPTPGRHTYNPRCRIGENNC